MLLEMVERKVAHPNSLVLFPIANKGHTLCNVAKERSLNFDGLGLKLVSGCIYVRVEQHGPFLHPRVPYPSFSSVPEQALDKRVHYDYSPTPQIAMFLHS